MAVRVKPLEWEETDFGVWRSRDGLGSYYEVAERFDGFQTCLESKLGGSGFICYDPAFEAAKAAAQADYEARILAALEPATDLMAELVEAASDLLAAVCGETGFASAVRAHSGLAYPWPALDAAEERLAAALAKIKEPT